MLDGLALAFPFIALALTAFFSATILPFSSEVALLVTYAQTHNLELTLISASVGNTLGITLNYFIGKYLQRHAHKQLQSFRWSRYFLRFARQHQRLTLLLTPLPIIGDPLTIIAGIIRINGYRFILYAVTLRIARYTLLLYLEGIILIS